MMRKLIIIGGLLLASLVNAQDTIDVSVDTLASIWVSKFNVAVDSYNVNNDPDLEKITFGRDSLNVWSDKINLLIKETPAIQNDTIRFGVDSLRSWSVYMNSVISFQINYPAYRGNTVGVVSVTPESYSTNDNATTYTVGTSDADYTDLITAYGVASSGDVIEIIDDVHAMSNKLYMTKGVDGSGKSIKIKGKSSKTILTLYNTNPSIELATSGGSIEFENIIFDNNNNVEPFRNATTAADGFAHFINCEFDGYQSPQFFDCQELVMDEVSFTNQVDTEVIRISSTGNRNANAKNIFNNIICDYLSTIDNFITHTYSGTTKLNSVSITNSDIKIKRRLWTNFEWQVDSIDIRGNNLTSNASTGLFKVGVEATGTVLDHYDTYNASTSYSIGDFVQYDANLWECVDGSTGNAPSKTSDYWQIGEVITGIIENNLFNGTTYYASGHGLFLGFGAYNFSVKNNIVTKYWWNYVVKGYNNTIQYNCAGEGLRGFAFIANNQLIVSNNTSRSDIDQALSITQQSTGTNVDNTTFKDNILTNIINGDDVFLCTSLLNAFNQNIYYGDEPIATYNSITYDLSDETEFNNFKTAIGDNNAQFLNPEWSGTDPLDEDYYLPTNSLIKTLKDANGESVGAVDIVK